MRIKRRNRTICIDYEGIEAEMVAGRPREYRNAADKQKAYRERKKQDEREIQTALALLELVKQREITLRNLMTYWTNKDKCAEVYMSKTGGFAQIKTNNHFSNTVEVITVEYMVMIGGLVESRKDWAGTYYVLS